LAGGTVATTKGRKDQPITLELSDDDNEEKEVDGTRRGSPDEPPQIVERIDEPAPAGIAAVAAAATFPAKTAASEIEEGTDGSAAAIFTARMPSMGLSEDDGSDDEEELEEVGSEEEQKMRK